MRDIARRLALRLGVVGLMNVQFARPATAEVYVLEVNPRASRTVPFIAKAVGVPLVELAVAGRWRGRRSRRSGFTEEPAVPGVFVKAPVFPFRRFPGVDPVLGPEMKSTGEVMGVEPALRQRLRQGLARRRRTSCRSQGTAFLSVHDRDKPALLPVARRLAELGFELRRDRRHRGVPGASSGLPVRTVPRSTRARPHVGGPPDQRRDRPGRSTRRWAASRTRTTAPSAAPRSSTTSPASRRSPERIAAAEGIAAQRAQPGFDVRSLQSLATPDRAPAVSSTSRRGVRSLERLLSRSSLPPHR